MIPPPSAESQPLLKPSHLALSETSSAPLYAAWTVALAATLGSLFFSEVMKLPPCVLCWYQRIFLYPLVFVIPVALVLKDTKIHFYMLALLVPGLLVAVYHNLLYYGVIAESLSPCREGISCTSKQIEWLGFITIPLLSLSAFIFLNVLCLIQIKTQRSKPISQLLRN